MPLRELLLCAAVPVSAEMERSAAQQRHVHHVLQGDGLLRHVLGHVAASAAATSRDVGTLTTEDELLPAASVQMQAPRLAPAALPDVIPSCDPPSAPSPDLTPSPSVTSPPPSADLHWALQLVFNHFRPPPPPPPPPPRKGGRATRREPVRGRGARLRDKPGSGGGGGGGGGGGDRPGSVSDTLRHVGEELRRIADQLQLNRLVGWPTHEEILRDVIGRHPLLTGLAGCALIAGVTAAVSRALRP